MRTLDVKLTLIDDLVASERPATEGGHASLDYLPGAMLLGAMAARLYAHVSRTEAFTLFHSGKVRFGDAAPLTNDSPSWPMPLCWHDKKSDPALDGGFLDPAKLLNFQHGRFAEDEQPKQLRDGFVQADGAKHTVQKRLRMKTAIDTETGRVDESQLFGYQAIGAGQCFAARIEADEDVPDDLWRRLRTALTDADELLLGRSRSAEYGRVRVESGDALWAQPKRAPQTANNSITLWCLTDLVLLDSYGQPTLEPHPHHLGLDRGQVDWRKSFLRFRRFAPWNAYRKAFDLERQVIRRGSVITLSHIDPPLNEAERAGLETGIGQYRETGMGRVCINPLLLAEPKPSFAPRTTFNTANTSTPPEPKHPLIRWLKKQSTSGEAHRQAERVGRAKAAELHRCYRLARTYAGLADTEPVGPSPAQWGSVYERARLAVDFAGLKQELLVGNNAVCKPKGEGWEDAFCDQSGVRSFFDWIKAEVNDWIKAEVNELNSVAALRVFAREAKRVAQNERDKLKEKSA